MDKLSVMRLFASVAQEGALGKGALALGVTHAAASRHLHELEAQLGARLINRTTRHQALTELGEHYLQSVRHILTSIDEAEACVRDEIGLPQGRLRVKAPSSFAFHQLARRLDEFRSEFPRVTLELSVDTVVTTLDEHFDVCLLLVEGDLPDSNTVARQLARTEIVVCASPVYLDRRGWPMRPSDLEWHDLVMPHKLRRAVHFQRVAQDGAPLAVETVEISLSSAAFVSTDTELNYLAAMERMGIAALPSFVVADALRAGRLVRVLADWRMKALRIYAAVPTRRHLAARTRVFIDFLCDRFGGADADPWIDPAPPVLRPKQAMS